MAESLFLEVVTPQKAIVSEEVQIVVAPGSEGEFGVLKNHTTFLTSLKVGSLRYKDAIGKERFVFINQGFAEVLPDRVTILAESAERRKNIDTERCQQAKDRAEKRLADESGEVDSVRAEAALMRAVQRIAMVKV
ncbi:MAG: F0F1 ATP synthase subunit epsilon [Desulfobacterales bacterium]|nr:F0F1 ATP synthase subunit epsilon [Desulfobacterales bacterium]